MLRAFEDKLAVDRSAVMVRRVLGTLGLKLADAQERGLLAHNVVRDLRHKRERRRDSARSGKLKIGVDIQPRRKCAACWSMSATLAAAGRDRGVYRLARLRTRGLRWQDVDLKRGGLHVRQRADRYNKIGAPKSEAGERSVPLLPMLVTVLREWKLACPKGELGLVFPNGSGNIESHTNIINRGLLPAMSAAGLSYSGLHSLRHFFASWCINRKADGGLELPPMTVKARMGHSSIQITFDRYGHLFPRGDDGAELVAAEKAFFS